MNCKPSHHCGVGEELHEVAGVPSSAVVDVGQGQCAVDLICTRTLTVIEQIERYKA